MNQKSDPLKSEKPLSALRTKCQPRIQNPGHQNVFKMCWINLSLYLCVCLCLRPIFVGADDVFIFFAL